MAAAAPWPRPAASSASGRPGRAPPPAPAARRPRRRGRTESSTWPRQRCPSGRPGVARDGHLAGGLGVGGPPWPPAAPPPAWRWTRAPAPLAPASLVEQRHRPVGVAERDVGAGVPDGRVGRHPARRGWSSPARRAPAPAAPARGARCRAPARPAGRPGRSSACSAAPWRWAPLRARASSKRCSVTFGSSRTALAAAASASSQRRALDQQAGAGGLQPGGVAERAGRQGEPAHRAVEVPGGGQHPGVDQLEAELVAGTGGGLAWSASTAASSFSEPSSGRESASRASAAPITERGWVGWAPMAASNQARARSGSWP